jgi:protein-arginine kinase activator protein McsA
METNDDLHQCETCDRLTDRLVSWRTGEEDVEIFFVCETCEEEARDWNDAMIQDELSDEEIAEIIREEEAQAAGDIAWMEANEVF